MGGNGGTSYWGGGGSGGEVYNAAVNGTAGQAYGSGGGGANGDAGNGGTGKAGIIVVYEYTSQGGADLAESYPVTDHTIGAGDIVLFNTEDPIVVAKAEKGIDKPLAGVISTDPGIVLSDGTEGDNHRPVALAGRIPTKVNLEGGPIFPGDRIAPSSQPGVGRKANSFEPTIGTAITPFTGEEDNQDTSQMGLVTVFVDMQEGFDTTYLTDILFNNSNSSTTNSTSTNLLTIFTPEDETDTIWSRLYQLAANFVDGVLTLAGLKAEVVESERVQTAEICVDDICVTRDQFAAVFDGAEAAIEESEVETETEEDGSGQSESELDSDGDTAEENATSTESGSEQEVGEEENATTTESSTETKGANESATSTAGVVEEAGSDSDAGENEVGATEPEADDSGEGIGGEEITAKSSEEDLTTVIDSDETLDVTPDEPGSESDELEEPTVSELDPETETQ
ncbi:MAG: hypothetical protein GY934_02845 [Gammaproteobacteria bacterium]|nr:hypothetical protein [Gammaproteobacteria bacterium]